MNEYIPPASLTRCFEKAMGICRGQQSQIEYLEEIAKVCPEIDPSVSELRVMAEHLERICKVGLKQSSQSVAS